MPLGAAELDAALRRLPAWHHDQDRLALHRRITFDSFAAALAAMARIGVVADKADHHPEWSNV